MATGDRPFLDPVNHLAAPAKTSWPRQLEKHVHLGVNPIGTLTRGAMLSERGMALDVLIVLLKPNDTFACCYHGNLGWATSVWERIDMFGC